MAVEAFAPAAAADVDLLAGGLLLTRANTRSAVSRSVNWVTWQPAADCGVGITGQAFKAFGKLQ